MSRDSMSTVLLVLLELHEGTLHFIGHSGYIIFFDGLAALLDTHVASEQPFFHFFDVGAAT